MATNKEQQINTQRFFRRKARTKQHIITGRTARPRLSVYRSLKHVSAQIIDDMKGITLIAATEHELSTADQKKPKTERAQLIGALVAKKALEKNITQVVFDRSGYQYHGRVKAVADAAREAGLQF